MAEYRHILKWQRNKRPFGMRSLLQLAAWGASASAALTLVVFAALSDVGSQRLTMAMAPADAGPRFQTPSVEQLAARSAAAENETRRLAEAVQTLGADRERLLTRIATLEHTLEDITGSIKRQASAASQTPSPPSSRSAPAETAAGSASPTTEVGNLSGSAALQSPPVAATSQELAATSRLAGLPTNDDAAEAERPRTEFGIDIGGGASFDALRLLWNATKAASPALFESLQPVVVARENRRTRTIELRLVAGPVGNADAAARLCGSLAGAARRSCQPAAFEGRQLSLVAPEPERPPVNAPARKPTPKAARPVFGE